MNPAKLLAIIQALSLAKSIFNQFTMGALPLEDLEEAWDDLHEDFSFAIKGWEEAGRQARARGVE